MSTQSSDQDLAHIHVGCGKLGLGLVVPVIKSTAIKTITLNRRDKSSYNKCSLLKTNRSYSLIKSTTQSSQIIDDIDFFYLDEQIPESFVRAPELLITTAVTPSGFTNILPFMLDILKKRYSFRNDGCFTYFIACENMPDNSQALKTQIVAQSSTCALPDFSDFVNSKCAFMNTIVDRICRIESPVASQIKVITEPNFNWIVNSNTLINRQQQVRKLKSLFADNINFVTEREFKFFEKRKAWFVNGGHLALATYAQEYGYKYLDEAYSNAIIFDAMKTIFLAFSIALQVYRYELAIDETPDWAKDEGIANYAQSVSKRFEQFHDTVPRILEDLLKTRQSSEQIEKLFDQLGTAELDRTAIKMSLIDLIQTMDIERFVSKITDRLTNAMMYIVNYDIEMQNKIFTDNPNLSHELIRLCEKLFSLISQTLKENRSK